MGPGKIWKHKKENVDSIKEDEEEGSPESKKRSRMLRFSRVTDDQVEELYKEMEQSWDENNIVAFHWNVILE